MRWLDASPRRAASKGHETFILRAASTSSHRLLQRRLLSAHAAQNTSDLSRVGSYEARTRGLLGCGGAESGVSCRFAGPGRAEQLRAERVPDPLLVRVRGPAALAD